MSVKRKDTKGRILKDGEIQKADGRYEFRYKDTNGTLRSLYSWKLTESDTIPAGKRACQSLRELEKTALRDVQDGVKHSKATLNDRWGNYILSRPELRKSTKTLYTYLYDHFVRDEIGNVQIASINYSLIKRFFNRLLNDLDLKMTTVDNINTVLHPVFTVAVRDGLIRANPMNGIMGELKKSYAWVRPKRHSLTEEQQMIFTQAIGKSPMKPLFILMLGTGCRVGEALGLRWQDVLWDEGVISINHILQYGMIEGKAKFSVSPPKTASGVRMIPMMMSVREALREEYKRQQRDGFCKSVVDGYSGFIFCNKNGRVLMPQNVNREINKIVKECGIPRFSSHQLRHTFCTRICQNETDLKLIQEVMGHSDISITMDIHNESNMERKKASFARLEAVDFYH